MMAIAQAEIQAAREALARRDDALARAHAVVPPFVWRSRAKGFAGLARLIIEQQVSVGSAEATWRRLQDGLGVIDAARILACDAQRLRSFGISAPKARYLHGLAEAHASGQLNLDGLAHLDDDAACETLMALKGIGRWTAEGYLMSCEARRDVFPAADIALQEAIRILDGAAIRLSTRDLYARSTLWRPYRSIAVHLLWDYYIGIKNGSISMPPYCAPPCKQKAAARP
jgi:DNA-3-methyladenine glycosylase II